MLTTSFIEEETETEKFYHLLKVTQLVSGRTWRRTPALNHCSFPWVFETEIMPGPKTNLAPRMAGADDLKGPAKLNLPAGLPHFSKC